MHFEQGIIRVSWWTWILYIKHSFISDRNYIVFVVDMDSVRLSDRIRIGAKSASGTPGPKSAPRGTKSTTFAHVFFQQFNLLKFSPQAGAMEPQGCLWLHSSRASLSQCMFSWCLTKAFVATMLSMIYPFGSTTKCKDNIIPMAIRSNFVVIVVPLWFDHKMKILWSHLSQFGYMRFAGKHQDVFLFLM